LPNFLHNPPGGSEKGKEGSQGGGGGERDKLGSVWGGGRTDGKWRSQKKLVPSKCFGNSPGRGKVTKREKGGRAWVSWLLIALTREMRFGRGSSRPYLMLVRRKLWKREGKGQQGTMKGKKKNGSTGIRQASGIVRCALDCLRKKSSARQSLEGGSGRGVNKENHINFDDFF